MLPPEDPLTGPTAGRGQQTRDTDPAADRDASQAATAEQAHLGPTPPEASNAPRGAPPTSPPHPVTTHNAMRDGPPRPIGRHRSDPDPDARGPDTTGGPPVRPTGAPPDRGPDRFGGFATARAAEPGRGTTDQGRGYRSLREMSGERTATAPTGARQRGREPAVADILENLSRAAPEQSGGWTRRRLAVLGTVAALLVVVLGAGGYAGYRFLAPYYGLGYRTGGTTVVSKVHVTAREVRCGLHSAPFGNHGTPQGVYCAITVAARNAGASSAFIDLHTWRANLDVDLEVAPVSAWLGYRREALLPGGDAVYQLAFDIPDGARLQKLQISIGGKKGAITVS